MVGIGIQISVLEVRRNVIAVVELGGLVVQRRRSQSGKSSGVGCRHERLLQQQILGRHGPHVAGGARGAVQVEYGRRRVGGRTTLEAIELLKDTEI